MNYQPYDYTVQQPDPSQAIMGGIKNAIVINEALFQRDERQRAQEAQQAAQARAQQQQADMAEVLKNPTLKAVQNITLKYPELGKMMENQINSLTSSEKDATIQRDLPLFMALKNGKPEVARSLVERHLEAAKNSGDEMGIFEAQNALDVLTVNPNAMIFALNGKLSAAMGGKNFADATATFDKNERDQQLQGDLVSKGKFDASKAGSEAAIKEVEAKFAPKTFLAELGLKNAQIQQSKASAASSYASANASNASAYASRATASRANAEANQISAGMIPVEKRPEAEGKMRKEYDDRTKVYQDVKGAYSRVIASANPKNDAEKGAADLSLIFGYMKMLDPGSVVREGEFANAENSGGVDSKVTNIYNKIRNGGRLTDGQRSAFTGMAKKLYSASARQEEEVRSGIGRIAKGYGLNTENIFYTQNENTPQLEKTQTTGGMPAGFKVLGKE